MSGSERPHRGHLPGRGLRARSRPFERLEVHGRERTRASSATYPRPRHPTSAVLDFADAVAAGRDPIAPGEQGLHILEATLAVYLPRLSARASACRCPPDHPVALEGVAGLARLRPADAGAPSGAVGLFGLT